MKRTHGYYEAWLIAAVVGGLAIGLPDLAVAHCDTTGGPVIPEAKAALEKGDITPILKWVKLDHEAEVKAAFARVVAVRGKGADARELADRYFLETLVRLHRAGEGAPYAGIKDEPVEPIVAMADAALASGSPEDMIAKISAHLSAVIREKYARVLETRKNKDRSVVAGREYVEAYVTYMHYVEGVHAAIVAAGGHHHAGSAPAAAEHAGHKD